MLTLSHFLILGAILFAISIVGIFLNRKNLIIILMSIELMLLAVNMNFIAFSHYMQDLAGQVFVFFILTVAAAESAIGLAILVVLFRNLKTIHVDDLVKLRVLCDSLKFRQFRVAVHLRPADRDIDDAAVKIGAFAGDAAIDLVGHLVGDPAPVAFATRKLQAFAQLRYQATPKFSLGSSVTYQSEMYAGQPDTAAGFNADGEYSYRVPGYTTVDVFANYEFTEKLKARLNVGNVFDRDYYLAAYRSGAFTYVGDARNAQLTLSAEF